RDWCYSEFVWERPKEQMIVDKMTGLNHGRMASSIFLFASPNTRFKSRNEPVIVGKPKQGNRIAVLLCTPQGKTRKIPLPQQDISSVRGEEWKDQRRRPAA